MSDKLEEYLANRADLRSRPLVAPDTGGVDRVVVMPLLAEGKSLSEIVMHLAANEPEHAARTLLIGVVNNPAHDHCTEDALKNNRKTLKLLTRMAEGEFAETLNRLRVGYVDASSEGVALPRNEGVGTARKFGMDWAVHVLRENGAAEGPIICLDGDTKVDRNYLAAIDAFYQHADAWAGVVDYAHPYEGTEEEQAAIVCYELFLRYYVLALRYAQSPYAFHTIGSTMTCRATAYAAVSGMNRRQAGEDFYFLQQLAKSGPVKVIRDTTVRPSPRASWRVPFGTGKRVRRFLDGKHNEYELYHPKCFEIVRRWLALVQDDPERAPDDLMEEAVMISPSLEAFLRSTYFEKAWGRILENSASPEQAMTQFNRWFDGFKTLKLIHHLRDDLYPLEDMFDAIAVILVKLGYPWTYGEPTRLRTDLSAQKALLETLREYSLHDDAVPEVTQ